MALHQIDLQSLNKGLSRNFARDLEIPQFRPYLLAHWRTFYKFFCIFNYSVFINFLLYAIIPLTLIRYGKYERMYPEIMPFSYEPGGLIHWSLYGFDIVAGYFLWISTCGVDSIFGLYSLQMVGELKLLSYRFQNLKFNSNYKKELKDCVDRHTELMEAIPVMERIFGLLAIYIVVTCAILLCTLIFQATETKNMSFLKVCYLICYSFLKLVQVSSYAWFGNIINVESQACVDSIYNAYWTDFGNLHFMNDVLIILSQKPLSFKAKGVMALELDVLSKVVNTSVSYFFLLRTLEETLDVSE